MIVSMPIDDIKYVQTVVPNPAYRLHRELWSALSRVPGLEPQTDAIGNHQGVFRVDLGEAPEELIVTHPAAVAATDIEAAVNALEADQP